MEFTGLEEENRLDFGTVKVLDIMEKYFNIINKGLYDIKYKFVMRRQNYRDNFKIIPSSGILSKDEEKKITVRFQSKDEMRLKTKNNSDIIL